MDKSGGKKEQFEKQLYLGHGFNQAHAKPFGKQVSASTASFKVPLSEYFAYIETLFHQ